MQFERAADQSQTVAVMKITLDVPDAAFSSLKKAPADFAEELTLAACAKWYELGRLSQARAAEICRLSRAEFLDALSVLEARAWQTSPEYLERESRL